MKHKIFILVIFFVVNLFISVAINTLESAYNNIAEMNMLQSKNSIGFEINNPKGVSGKEFLNIIKSEKDIVLQKDGLILGSYFGKAIFFDSNSNFNLPLINGRFLTKQDFDENTKVAVIGKNLRNITFFKNGNEFLKYEKEDYLVVGILGHTNRSSNFDDFFFLSLGSLLPKYENLEFFNNLWVVDNKNSEVESSFNNLNSKVTKLNSNVTLNRTFVQTSKSYLEDLLSNRIFSLGLTAIVIVVLILNIVNATNFYIESKRKEIGVRKTFGATNFQIAKKILLDYEFQAVTAFFIAQIFYIILIKYNIAPLIFGDSVYFLSTFISFIFILTIGSIVAAIPILKSFKLQPNQIIKGR
jgi:putative ABC transport system permease protein